jgi:hypothetical protein
VSTLPQKAKKESTNVTEPHRISLESIGLNGITERQDVHSRCGRDVTLLVNEDNEDKVPLTVNVITIYFH